MREQWCCGGPAAEMGYVDLAKRFARAQPRRLARGRRQARASRPTRTTTSPSPRTTRSYFGDDYDVRDRARRRAGRRAVRDGTLEPTMPVERTITYHDPCRLNKRKGIRKEPREILRACPASTSSDVDRVTQWSYCSGARRRPAGREARDHGARSAAAGSRRPAELEVDTLVSACPWSERPLRRRGRGGEHRRRRPPRAAGRVARDRVGRRAATRSPYVKSAGRRRGDRSRSSRGIIGDARAAPDDLKPARLHRARVPAPFPVHRWADHMPDVGGPARRAPRRSPRSSRSPTACGVPSSRAPAAPASPTAPSRCAAASSSTSSGWTASTSSTSWTAP